MSAVTMTDDAHITQLKKQAEERLLSLGYILENRYCDFNHLRVCIFYYPLGYSRRRIILDLTSPQPIVRAETYSGIARSWQQERCIALSSFANPFSWWIAMRSKICLLGASETNMRVYDD